MNKIVIIGLLVALVGVAGYFIVNQQTPPPEPIVLSTPTPTLIPSPTPTLEPSSTPIPTIPVSNLPNNFDYPHILKPLSETQLTNLRSEFENSNKNVCAKINEYGFTEYDCLGEIIKVEITDKASVVDMVKDWLIQNSKFTGVTNESDAIVSSIIEKTTLLQIYFHGQTYNNLPVEGDISPLIVFANAEGVSRIEGHRFPIIIVPLEPKVSEASAKSKLIGRIFTYADFGGNPVDYRVEQKDLNNVTPKVVFVKKSTQGLEFRLAWKIQIGQGLSWTVYIDAITGEELKVRQMFQT